MRSKILMAKKKSFVKININILHKIKVLNLQIMLNFCDLEFLDQNVLLPNIFKDALDPY